MRKKLIAVLVVLLAAICLACVWRSYTNAAQEAEAKKAEVEEQAEAAPDGRKEAEIDLTDAQKRKVAAYDADARYVADVLEGNLWESRTGTFAEFEEGAVIERTADGEEAQPFVIGALEHKASSDGSGGTVDVYTGSVELKSGEAIFTLSQAHSADAGDLPWVIKCSGLRHASEYQLVKRSAGVEVSDLSAAFPVIGGEKGADQVAKALEKHVSRVAPTATKAQWDGKAEVDFNSGTTTLSFKLDDSKESVVEVAVSEKGEVSFQ